MLGRDVSSLCAMSRLFANSSSMARGRRRYFCLRGRSCAGVSRDGELGVDEADVVEAESAECVAQPGFAVVPAYLGAFPARGRATCGGVTGHITSSETRTSTSS